jgi:hypothetical protein
MLVDPDTQIVAYDCPNYWGYTISPTMMQVLQSYFAILMQI